MNEITITRFHPRKADPKDWLQYHIFRKERHEEAEPDRSLLPDFEIEETKKKEHPFGGIYEWVARGDGVIIANAVTFIQRPDTPGYTERAKYLGFYCEVLSGWRRQGIGKQMLGKIYELMCAHGKALLTVSSDEMDGHGFLKHIGASERSTSIQSRVALDQVAWNSILDWENVALKACPGGKFVTFASRIPEDQLASFLPIVGNLMEDMPLEELDHPPIVLTVEEYHEWYHQLTNIPSKQMT